MSLEPNDRLAHRAVTVDGKMIDVPVVERARLLLERDAAIAAREARKRAAGAPPA